MKNTYQAGQLHDMLKDGKLRSVEEVEETLTLVRQALARDAWKVEQRIINQYQADICLLLDMQRYYNERVTIDETFAHLPEIIVRGVQ